MLCISLKSPSNTQPLTKSHNCLIAQAEFLVRMEIKIQKKNEKEILVEEGFYSRSEMITDLGWSETLICTQLYRSYPYAS